MKRDRMRELLQDVSEWTALASTPPPLPLFRATQDESEPTEGSYPAVTDSRPALRDMAIDLNNIIGQFLTDLSRQHGSKRVERLMEWIHEGYISRYDRVHRCQIREDRRRLKLAVRYHYYGRKTE